MTYIPLEKLHLLHDGYRRIVKLAGRDLLLLQVEGQVYLLENRCPHMDAPLHKAVVNGHVLRCPKHAMEFDLRTGQPLGSAADCVGPLAFLSLVYEGNTLGIEIN